MKGRKRHGGRRSNSGTPRGAGTPRLTRRQRKRMRRSDRTMRSQFKEMLTVQALLLSHPLYRQMLGWWPLGGLEET